MKVIEGKLNAKDLKFGIVVGRFNEFISSKFIEQTILEFADSSPPFLPKTPIFITNQVFLI